MTGSLGPAGWVNGRHDRRLARFPVTGVCFHEAAAYARWAGYRLPDEAEWQAAATWSTLETGGAGRRYPWGDALETAWCNIWESRCGGKLPVDMLPEGAAPNGVLQLIGNVWEWTDSPFVVGDCGDSGTGPVMKSVRGAAFDTYFTHEAAGSFRSGLPALSRAPNVGFRCAMDFAEPTE
jgi:iron(II)-dependent oxidoreductase